MEDLSELFFTPGHEWIRVENDTLVIGFTEHAEASMGDVLNVELPEPDEHHYEPHEEIGVVEGEHATREFRAPLPGVIESINTRLLSHPELINQEPYGDGWLVVMKPDTLEGLQDLLLVDEYEEALPDEDE